MRYSVVGLGNPLLDTTATVEDAFLEEHGFTRGGMHLIDLEQSARLMQLIRTMNPSVNPGGSVANALASAVSLGGRALFLGAIGKDEYGEEYRRLIQGIGIESALRPVPVPQGSCTVMVTADGERTMATHLGAAVRFEEDHLEEEALRNTDLLHVEGYQLDSPNQTEAARMAMSIVKEAGGRVAMDCSDTLLVQRHRKTLEAFIDEHVDILLSNGAEARELTGKDPEEAIREIAARVEVSVVTLGEEGCLVMSGDEIHRVPGVDVEVVNTNGAGDTFAGAFLQSFLDGKGLKRSATIASYMAGQVVAREGSRVEGDYTGFVRELEVVL